MPLSITIGGVNREDLIQKNSLQIESVLTRQVDRCKFAINKYGGAFTFVPSVGQEVIIMKGSTKLFGGLITKITQGASQYKIVRFEVECEDYTRLLDRKLVVKQYTNETVAAIIEDLKDTYLSSEFSTTGVINANIDIEAISFNYMTMSECLTKLADLYNYDWYVDYDKVIHFFDSEDSAAPFNLADDTGTFIFESLRIRRDNSQMRNRVYVRGGEYLGETITSEFVSDGIQNTYTLPYKYSELRVTVTGGIWEGGIEGIDPVVQKDYIWNPDEKFIRFRGDRIPNDTSSFRVSGPPFLPVRVVVQDSESINLLATAEGDDGISEFLIIDDSINSKQQARERARAELDAYKDTLSEGSFDTYTDGLRAGQTIRITSAAHGIDEDFVINRVVARDFTVTTQIYSVSVVTTKTIGIIEILQSLLKKDQKTLLIDKTEVLDVVYSQNEQMSIQETVTAQSLNYPVQFVTGPTTPNGFKRQFVIGGSPLA